MKRFVEGADRGQSTLLPECLDEWVEESNSVRVVDCFVDGLDLADLGFEGVKPAATGRPAYHPSVLLKLYIYGYLNRVQSSRRLEREAGRNLEVIWLLGRLVPDDKGIGDFRKDNGPAIRRGCANFVKLCRLMELLAQASVAIDDRKIKALNNRDCEFTPGKIEPRRAQLEASADRGYYNGEEIQACEQAGICVTLPKPMTSGAKSEGRFGKQDFVYLPEEDVYRCPAGEKLIFHYANEEHGQKMRRYWTNACKTCAIKEQCTTGKERRITRWEHEHVLETVQQRLDQDPQAMRRRRETVEHHFGHLKRRMGATHFLMKTLPKVASEMALSVLAYNLTPVMNIVGTTALLSPIRA